MNETDHWPKIEELFDQASELAPGKRGRFLDENCADAALRAEVEELLRYREGSERALHSTIGNVAEEFQRHEAESLTGKRIGAYDLVRPVGQGGMGTVYLATRSDEHFHQQVAIKILSRGMDNKLLLPRFLRERQVLANLSHPNISRLLDGGATPEGLPFFAMEYLEGLPITSYCREKALPVEDRLRLFLPVCAAVHYAHRKLVIHGDIKPANILVTADGIPKLLDFGLAKLVGEHREPGSGDAMLTPEFASPEQLRGEAITTATDIYSLGAVLEKVLEAGREQTLPRDLECIVEKGKRPSPEDRYGSAQEFAEDIQRFLNHRPVLAHPSTFVYRASHFVRRNRLNVTVAGVLTVMAGATLGLYVHQAQLTQRRFRDLHHLANSFVFDFDDRIRVLPGSTRVRAMLVQRALEYLSGLAAEKGSDAELQREVGNAYRRVGDLQGDPLAANLGDSAGARRSYEHSIALLEPLADRESRKDLIRSEIKLAWLERVAGDIGRAHEIVAKTLPLAQSTALLGDPDSMALLGNTHVTFCWVLESMGAIPAAAEHAAKALSIYQPLAASNQLYLEGLGDAYSALGGTGMRAGKFQESLENYRQNLKIRQQLAADKPQDNAVLRNLMLAHSHIGDILGSATQPSLGDAVGALASYEQVLAIARRISANDASDKNAILDVSISLMRVGNALAAARQPQSAIANFREALGITDKLTANDPGNGRLKQTAAFLEDRIGSQMEITGQRGPALEAYRRSIAISRETVKDAPKSEDAKMYLVRALEEYAGILSKSGDRSGAVASVPEIAAVGEQIAANGASERLHAQRPLAYSSIAELYENLHDGGEAQVWYRRTLDAWNGMKTSQPLGSAYAGEPARIEAKLAKLEKSPR